VQIFWQIILFNYYLVDTKYGNSSYVWNSGGEFCTHSNEAVAGTSVSILKNSGDSQ